MVEVRVSWFEEPVKYTPSHWVTQKNGRKWEPVAIPPASIANLDLPNPDTVRKSVIDLQRAALGDLINQMAFRKGRRVQGPVTLSGAIPAGEVHIDGNSIILNEAEALGRAIDCDGDQATLILIDNSNKGIFMKWPLTKEIPVMTIVEKSQPLETFLSVKKKDLLQPIKPFNPEVETTKRHIKAEVGTSTRLHDFYDLREVMKKAKYLPSGQTRKKTRKFALLGTFLANPKRFDDIELNGFKVVSKGNEATRKWLEPEDVPYKFKAEHFWILAASSIWSIPEDDILKLGSIDLQKAVESAQKGLWEFTDSDLYPAKSSQKWTPRVVKSNIVEKLMALGLIGYKEYPHEVEGMPPAILIWLKDPKGRPAALTDVKRQAGESSPETLTFGFTVSPIWSQQLLTTPSGEESTFKGWLHPIQHLALQLASFDDEVINPATQQVVRIWPSSKSDFLDTRYARKQSMLLRAILQWASSFGEIVPTKSGDAPIISEITEKAIAQQGVVDFGRAFLVEEMLEGYETPSGEFSKTGVLYEINKELGSQKLCIWGSKAANNNRSSRMRKYFFSHPDSLYPLSVDPKVKVNPRRACQSRSQMTRAAKEVRLKVAVVRMKHTTVQPLICPTGIEKQGLNESLFLRQWFATLPLALKHWEELPESVKESNAFKEFEDGVPYTTWTGQQCIGWATIPRATAEIGKLICPYGQKFIPRKYDQARTKDGEALDLLIPIEEILDKEVQACYHDFQEMEIVVDGKVDGQPTRQQVTALVGEVTLYRVGTWSENMPLQRGKRANVRGVPGMYLRELWARETGTPVEWPKLDLSQWEQTQRMAKRLSELVGDPDLFASFSEDEIDYEDAE